MLIGNGSSTFERMTHPGFATLSTNQLSQRVKEEPMSHKPIIKSERPLKPATLDRLHQQAQKAQQTQKPTAPRRKQ